MRTINDVIGAVKQTLTQLGSSLASFPTYGNLYMLIRAIAPLITEQDNLTAGLTDSFYVGTASGTYLDKRAADLGLLRNRGVPSTGDLLVTGQGGSIPLGTILSDVTQTLQYQVTRTTAINGETRVPVQATTVGSQYNLEAGTPLYSSFYASYQFVVGSTRDIFTGKPYGALSGGLNPESDEQLRSRCLYYVRSLNKGTLSNLVALMGGLQLGRYYLKENYPVAGYVTIYVETRDALVLSDLNALLVSNKPLGLAFRVRPLTLTDVSVAVTASTNTPEQYASLLGTIKERVLAYGSSLDVGAPLYTASLAALILSIDGITACEVVQPTATISPPAESSISISYVSVDLRST